LVIVLVMTHAHYLRPALRVRLLVIALGDGRSVPAVSYVPSSIAATVASFSIATTAGPSACILRCNSATSDAWAENGSHILSANTAGCAAAAPEASSVSLCGVDFYDDLKDLG